MLFCTSVSKCWNCTLGTLAPETLRCHFSFTIPTWDRFPFSGRVALVAQRPIVFKLSRGRSVGRCAGLSSSLWKKADRIRMLFGIVGRTGPGMRQVVGFGDQSTRMGTFGGEFGARHCNQWGLYGVRVRQCRDAALFPNYFEQTCYSAYRF